MNMKRNDVLKRLGYTVPESKRKRVIIHSDVRNEADDHFAIMHHLLTPSHDVLGIVAGHFEWVAREHPNARERLLASETGKSMPSDFFAKRGQSMELSFLEGKKLLELAEIEDIPLIRGSEFEITDLANLPQSEGADFIIAEAMKEDPRPLYVTLLGSTTDMAIALIKEPQIANRLTVIFIGGGSYPSGGDEFNIKQDLCTSRILFEKPVPLWQIPEGTYKTMEFSFAEMVKNIQPCGALGAYLCQQMFDFNDNHGKMRFDSPFPHGETWCIGDNPTVSVLLQSKQRICWHTEKAPFINDDLSYTPNPNGKDIRVYDSIDTRLTVHDLFAKLSLCYGNA